MRTPPVRGAGNRERQARNEAAASLDRCGTDKVTAWVVLTGQHLVSCDPIFPVPRAPG
jgi:hypothetical protein